MAYLANNHKGSQIKKSSGPSKPTNQQGANNNSLVKKSRNFNNNGYKSVNNYGNKNDSSGVKETLQKVKEKQKKEVARNALVTGLKAYNPAIGAVAEKALKTPKGEKLLDAYAKGSTPQEGINNVAREIKKETRRKTFIITLVSIFSPLLLLIFLFLMIFKNADSQIFSNENGGTVESENYGYDDKDTNIFANYPGLYEKVVNISNKVGDKYKIEIDKFLIIATLIAPIDNGLITPVTNGNCGEEECYYYDGKYLTWTDFLDTWSDQTELLAKMQIMTYTNPSDGIDVNCGSEQTMEQYAKNDFEIREHYLFWWINPANWFVTFRNAVEAELNAKCTEAPSGKTKVPTVYTLSTEQGEYYLTNNANHEFEYVKDPNSGGVYFWNLLNQDGFIHMYLKDYLSDQYKNDSAKNYEINKDVIISTTNYIYAYYDSIRKDCESHKVLESTIEKIKIYNPPEKQSRFNVPANEEIDFEDQYIGGVMLAEYNSGNMESLKAFAILARTEAVAIVGMDGSGTIENSSNDQNYDPTYTPEKYPEIAEAVRVTRGLVLSKYKSPKVWHTEYDAFCPQKNVLEGGFYYLPEGQQSLPINPDAYEAIAHEQFINPNSKYLDCPCFRNNDTRPHDDDAEDNHTRYYFSLTEAPTFAGGDPSQETKDICWKTKDTTKTDDDGTTLYGWKYKPTGGHGRGASQYGLKYFGAFGYDQDALLRMFFPGASIRVLSSSLENGKCAEIPFYEGEVAGSYSSGESNYEEVIGGTALTKPLTEALAENGYAVSDLNKCIGDRVNSAGYATRDGVVEAGMGLLECTMDMTGGYTYPYDHLGGYVGRGLNPDIIGKLGVNSKWGEYASYATGCSGGACRLGLNCANFVRWSMCNGGMDLCSKGSTYATGMAGVNSSENYFPGATRVKLTPGFSVLSGSLTVTSKEDAINMIQPGDVLYSDIGGKSNHVMLIVGTNSNSITIAENGRKTRTISKDELRSSSTTYVVLLLDDYYANASNKNSLSW